MALLYLVALGCAYPNVLFKGKSLVYTDNRNPADERLIAQNYGEKFVPAEVWADKNYNRYPNLHDPGATWWQWEPAAEFLRTGLEKRELPFWDPYVAGGTPAMTNVISALAFPPYVAVVLAGNTAFLRNAYYLFLLFAAALFTYLFLRKHGLLREACFLGGVVFLFCGGLIQNAGSFIGQAAACVPFVLYLVRRFLDRPEARRLVVLAFGMALVSLASFPPLLVGTFGTVAIYAVSMILSADRPSQPAGGRARLIALFAAACGLAFGLVGFYFVPFVALVRATPYVSALYKGAALLSMPFVTIYDLLSPVALGGRKVFAQAPFRSPSHFSLFYLGVAPIALAALAGPVQPKKAKALFWIFFSSTALLSLKLFGVQPVQSLGRLPILKNVHMAQYFGIYLDFFIAVLAAIGLERLASGRPARARAAFASLLVALLLGGAHHVAIAGGLRKSGLESFWLRSWAFLVGTAILILASILLASILSIGRAKTVVVAACIALCMAEGAFNAYYPRQYTWNVWRHPVPYVQELQREAAHDRVLGLGALEANLGSAYEVFEIDSLMAFNPERIYDFYHRYFSRSKEIFLRSTRRLPEEGPLDRADLRYLIVAEGIPSAVREASRRGYESIFADGTVRIFRRASSPRYYFTSDYQLATPARALDLAGSLPPGRGIAIEEQPEFSSQPNAGDDPAIQVLDFHRNSLTLGLFAPRPGLVYCAESYFDGWSATVNGRPTKILPANYAFRAVEVPAGTVRVHLSYWPPGLMAGLALTAGSLLFTVALSAGFVLRRREGGPL